MFTALDIVPFRIQGSVKEPVTLADAYLETIMCPYMRSCFDQALKGYYDFLDGLVVPHSCDTVQRIYDIWRHYKKPEYSHFINIPHMLHHPASYQFFRQELERFRRSLEEYTGKELTPQALARSIAQHNENRQLQRSLYQLRKPPLISGAEVIQVLVAGMTVPVEEYNQLLREVIADVKGRSPLAPRPRVLVYGSETDDEALIRLVEDYSWVVMDDLCTGTRCFWCDVEPQDDPLMALAHRYLDCIPCPRTYKPRGATREEDLRHRFGYLHDFVRDWQVQGVIFYIIRFCDTHELDVPDVRKFLEEAGVPVLHLEDDYSLFTMGQLRTRIQAFLEMIS